MRCYFMRAGHIVGVELLGGLSDEEAIEKSHQLFAATRKGEFDGFELWNLARVILRHPPIEDDPKPSTSSAGPLSPLLDAGESS
jgi:hypothetical protein